jgi:hypothetical protein
MTAVLIPLESAQPICHGCADFVPSDRTPCVGSCRFHGDRVLNQDKACSHYCSHKELQLCR